MSIDINRLGPAARQQIAAKLAVEQVHKMKQSESKYHAKKVDGCLIDGTPHTFDSVKEADRYSELAVMQRAGQISDLRVQVPYELIPKQRKADGKAERGCCYVADFVYRDKDGNEVVEDTKGMRTKEYVIKRKLMLWVHHITIREI